MIRRCPHCGSENVSGETDWYIGPRQFICNDCYDGPGDAPYSSKAFTAEEAETAELERQDEAASGTLTA